MIRRPSSLLFALVAGCDTVQSAAGKDGRHGELVSDLFGLFLVVLLLLYAIVFLFLMAAIFRRRGRRADCLPDEGESSERPLRSLLVGWTGFIALVLAGLAAATWIYDRRLAEADSAPAVEIEVTARQFWWDVRYLSDDPSRVFRTANELHLPAGVAARLTLRSSDVIHSFWIPNLAGKQDMIPGRVGDLVLRPLRPGVFRGQCAEFCGIQHANMALDVIVESPAEFAAWREAQVRPARQPATPLARAGLAFVTGRECASCHSIAGTPASAQVAPDLTHLAGRRSIAAGRLPMSRENLAAWIADPQGLKPGNNMPNVAMTSDQLRAVVSYLETLE